MCLSGKDPGDRGPEIIMEFRIAHLWDSTKQENVLKNGEIESLTVANFLSSKKDKSTSLVLPCYRIYMAFCTLKCCLVYFLSILLKYNLLERENQDSYKWKMNMCPRFYQQLELIERRIEKTQFPAIR